jgi:hypothetical protein
MLLPSVVIDIDDLFFGRSIAEFGAPPELEGDQLRAALDSVGLSDLDLTVKLVIGSSKSFPGKGLRL